MNREVSVYLDTVCAQIKSKQIRLSTRAELAGHIQALLDELETAGSNEEEATQTALERMGSPYAIGKQIAAFNAPWQNRLAAIAGFALLAAIIVWLGAFRGGYIINVSALILVLLLTAAFILIGGLSRLTRLSALARGRAAALYAGGISLIIGIMDMLATLNDPAQIGPALSFCITSLLYGLIVSAVLTSAAHLCRPLEGDEIRRILGWEEL